VDFIIFILFLILANVLRMGGCEGMFPGSRAELAPYSQTVGSLFRTPWPEKPTRIMI